MPPAQGKQKLNPVTGQNLPHQLTTVGGFVLALYYNFSFDLSGELIFHLFLLEVRN